MASNDPAFRGFLDRLLQSSRLSEEEQDAILNLPGDRVKVGARADLIRPRETVNHAVLVADGLLSRFDLMSDGARQLTTFHIPGDMCDLHSVVAPMAGWGITALSASTVLHVPHTALRTLVVDHPAIALAFWRDTVLDASIIAKWVANVGRKNSRHRIAHLLCEMGMRMERAGLGTRTRYRLPATQEQIGDAMGLTPVHVNRMLQELRSASLVAFDKHQVEIFDWRNLTEEADFEPSFLLALGGVGAA